MSPNVMLRPESTATPGEVATTTTSSVKSLVLENLGQIFRVKGTLWMVGKQSRAV